MFISRHTLKWTKTCRSSGDFPHAHTAHFLLNRHSRHWDDILAYFDHRRTNAVLEGLNSIIQNVKTRARDFRNMDYFSTMIYLTCGRLDLRTVAT